MNDLVSVSIIMPSLNVVDYIGEAIESVCKQTLKNIEILCIDAGSTDGTLEQIKQAQCADKRIRLLKSEYKSYGYQVNLGIENSRGEYIQIVETDDYIDSEMCQTLYEVAKRYDVDYAKANYKAFFSQDQDGYYFFSRHTFSDLKMYDRVIKPIDVPFIAKDDWYLWQGIYKRDYLINNRIRFSESKGAAFQDIGFLFWTNIYAQKAIYIKEELYRYRIGREGASSNQIKGLFYSAYEFENIIGKLDSQEKENIHIMKMYYNRMARSFISCIDRIKCFGETQNSDFIEKYNWFCSELKNAVYRNLIDEEILGSVLWKKLSVAIDSYKKYFDLYIVLEDKNWKTYDKYIIFGCGEFGYMAYTAIKEMNKKIVGFFDNNNKLWNCSINGVLISNALRAEEIPGDIGIVVANEFHSDEIKTQLSVLGYSDERIILFR